MTCLKYSKASFSPSSYSEKTCRENADASRPHKILRFSRTFNVCLHLMYFEAAWGLVSPKAQVFPQIILNPDCLPNYLSVSCDYGWFKQNKTM